MKLFDTENCEYFNDGKGGMGHVNCPGLASIVPCVGEDAKAIKCPVWDFSVDYISVVRCEW